MKIKDENNNEIGEVYYRIYRAEDNKIVFPCMQSFDECDYEQDRFLSEERFETEDKAKDGYLVLIGRAKLLLSYPCEL